MHATLVIVSTHTSPKTVAVSVQKNLIDHMRQCNRDQSPKVQMMLTQCIRQPPKVSKADLALLKQHEVKYCANGYHSFCSVDHDGLRDSLQACVNIGAKYRKTDISESLAGCKAVSREASQMAKTVKDSVMYITREPIDDGSISPGIDMYMDDYRKKSLLDVHATWIDRNFAMDHAVPACNTSGSCAHGSEHRGSR